MKRVSTIITMSLAFVMLLTCFTGINFPATINAAGSVIYVSITGSDDTGDGTIGNPYRTLYTSSKKLTQGDTLIIGGGAYGPSDSLWLTKTGTIENPITIQPADGELVTVLGAGMYNRLIYAAGVSYITIKNLNFDNIKSGRPVQITVSSHITIDGCTFRNGTANGDIVCYTNSSYCTIRNSVFDTNGGDLLGSGAGDAINGASSHHMLIENNYLTKNGHYAISFGIVKGTTAHSYNNVVRQNYIDEKWGGGVGFGFFSQNNIIEDNVIKNSGVECISYPKTAIQIASDTNIVRNNLLLYSKNGRAELQSQSAFDDNLDTGWEAPYSSISYAENEKHWLAVDLGSNQTVDKVVINWGEDTLTNLRYYKEFTIQTSIDGQVWDTVATISNGAGQIETIPFSVVSARYIKMNGVSMPMIGSIKTQNGCKINEFQVFGTSGTENLALNKVSVSSSTKGSYDNGICLYSYTYEGSVENCINNRVYNNVIYGNGGAAVAFSNRNETFNTKNKIVNNIMYKNRKNGFYNYYGTPGFYTITVEASGTSNKWNSFPNENYINNNIIMHADEITQYKGYDKLFKFDYGNWAKSLEQVQTDYSDFIYDNKEENPLFTNEYDEDFSLSSNSPAIDAGAHLAKTTAAASTPTNQVEIDDALFFSDGYGIISGDVVVIGQNLPNRITAIDYTTNTLTLETAITFDINDWVDHPYNGESPDIGAIEYGTTGDFPVAISAMPPQQTLAPTPTPTQSSPSTPTPTYDPAEGSMMSYLFHKSSQGDGLYKYKFFDGTHTTYNGIVTSGWRISGADNIYTDMGAPDATISYKIQGTKLKLYVEKNAFCGIAGITILDESGNVHIEEQLVDFFSEKYMNTIGYISPELPYGIYTIVIRVTGEVNDESPFIQYNQELEDWTPVYWTINLLKLEVFNSSTTPTSTATPTATETVSPTETATPTPVPTFSDVQEEDWYYTYIQSLAEKGILNGYEDGTFSPDTFIIRAEFIKVLTVAFGVHDINATIDNFSDVKPTDWFYSYVASGVDSGLASPGGLGNGTFGSAENMTREQAITFSARAMVSFKGYEYLNEAEKAIALGKLGDSDDISDYAKDAVALFFNSYKPILAGYVDQYDVITIKPLNNITRAEIATITDKVMNLEDLN